MSTHFTLIELSPYIDGNGLLAPCKADPHASSSDNGVMFSSECILIDPMTKPIFAQALKQCIVGGYLRRYPSDTEQDAPDDYYGILALKDPTLNDLLLQHPMQLVWGHIAPHLQIQLLGMALETRLGFANPLRLYNAIVITLLALFSRKPTPDASNVDLWRMGWLIVKGMESSLMCKVAGAFWRYMRKRAWGPDANRTIAQRYYRDSHPFTTVSWE